MVVDGGDWAVGGQGYGSWTGAFMPDKPGSKAFDGLYATGSDVCIPENINDPCVWTGEINIPSGATVQMVYRNQDSGVANAYFRINNTEISVVGTGTGNDVATVDITTAAGSKITKIEIKRGVISVGGMGIGAILINDSAVTGDSYTNGSAPTGDNTVKTTKSGTGTVDSVDVSTNSMVLTAESNDQWIEDYHVGTATKPAVTSTAYLQFDSTGAVSGYQATPVAPIAMDNKLSPTLTFPAEFESLQKTPDEEFSDTSAYLQTNVKLTNIGGSSNKDSNPLVPTTTSTFAIHECDVCYNAEGVANMYANVLSKGIREATIRLINAEETVAQTLERVKNFVETYVDSESH